MKSQQLHAILGLILLAFMGACFFAYPSYDDFDYAALFNLKGYWEFQNYHYFSWGGRYSSNALISGLIALDPIWDHYAFWSFTVLALTYAAIFYMFGQVSKISGPNFFLVFLVSLIACFPTIVQAFYWVTGVMTYTTSIAGGALGVGLIYHREKRETALVNFLLLLLTIVVVGFNEIALLGWLEILSTYLVLKFLKTKSVDKTLLGIILVGVVCGLLSLFAPGNFIRQNHFEKNGQVFRTVGNGVLHFVLFSLKLLSPALVVVLIRWRRELIELSEKVLAGIDRKVASRVIFAHWFLFIFSTTALAFWAMGRKPNTRSMNVITFYYWLMLPFILWLINGAWNKPMPQWVSKIFNFVDRKWLVLFLLLIATSKNVRNLAQDYLSNFLPYRQEMLLRNETLKGGAGKAVILEQAKTKPNTTFYSDLGERDPENLKSMFKLESVTIIKSESK